MQVNPNLSFYAFDFSPRAVAFVKVRECRIGEQTPRNLGCSMRPTAARLMLSGGGRWWSVVPRMGEQEHVDFDASRCQAFVCDPTTEPLPAEIPENSCDAILLIFVLSAISPEKMPVVLEKAFKVLKPGGAVLFRDYAYDGTARPRGQ